MKYKTKPIEVDAFQMTESVILDFFIDSKPLPFGVRCSGGYDPKKRILNNAAATIKTARGVVTARVNDWIVRHARGNLTVWKPLLFEKEYDKSV